MPSRSEPPSRRVKRELSVTCCFCRQEGWLSLKSCGEMCPRTWQGFRKAFSVRVGSEFKAARKKAGISVEVVSKRTKIHVSKLVALERDDFKNLPTGLYLFST